jgi:ABC-2 type transport system permease protein
VSARTFIALLRHQGRQHVSALLPMATGISLFAFVITRLAPLPSDVSWMSGILAAIPPQLLALAGGEPAFASPGGVIALSYGHPFFLLLLAVWAVRVPSSALAGEVGRGTMDLLASRPASRWEHVLAASVATLLGLGVLVSAAWSGTALGVHLRPLGLGPNQFLRQAFMAWLLFGAWGAVSLLVSAASRDAGRAIAWTSGVITTSFVLEYLARLWTPIAGLRPWSLFAYYRPQQLLPAGPTPSDVARLTAVLLIASTVAFVVFQRRDL